MNRVNWPQISVFAIVTLLVFLIGASLLGGFGRYGYGPGMMGPGMMGGGGFGPFGWVGMLFMWIIPLGFLTLLVAGIVWLVRAVTGSPSAGPPAPPAPLATGVCPACGRPTQTDWQHCPYCCQSLA